MKTKLCMTCGILAMLSSACTDSKQAEVNKLWEQLPVVAQTVEVDGQEMLVCDYSALDDSVSLPLSAFTEELQMVKLDNRDEALVGMSLPIIGDNYILVSRFRNVPCKLFKKDGTFVGNVGNIGQGPGEYQMIYDMQLDEANGRIYLLPWNAKSLLVYDMTGKYLHSIPLYNKNKDLVVPKGTFHVDAKNNRVGVFLLPFDYLKTVAWIQDMEGNVIQEIPMNHLKIRPDFSNEILMNKTNGAFDMSVFTYFELRPDTLYHYDMNKNRLLPQFTLDFGSRDIAMHSYAEFPNHYLGDISKSEQISSNMSVANTTGAFVVSKKDKKGAFYSLYNDYLGDMPIAGTFFWNCRNNYYVQNVEPGQLMEDLENALKKNPNMDEKMKQKLKTMLAEIDDNDNNYIFYAKLK